MIKYKGGKAMCTENLKIRFVSLFLLAGLVAVSPSIAEVTVSGHEVIFHGFGGDKVELAVSGPDGYHYKKTFDQESVVTWEALKDGITLPDGRYVWELRRPPSDHGKGVTDDLRGRGARSELYFGTFTIVAGTLIDPNTREEGLRAKDVVHSDDVIIDGGLCVGDDCVNGESFEQDTIRLKENNLRVHFDDTSISTFPSNDWRIVVNDTTDGGASYFAIEDSTASRQVLRIEADAPASSLYVDSDGHVGIGTSTPDTDLHIRKTGSTERAEIKMETGNQEWILRGIGATGQFAVVNNTNFAIPFRIDDGADHSLLHLGLDHLNSPDSNRVTINGELDVTDAILYSGAQQHPDYVFEPDYELESIADHAAFMWSEKHLPAVPEAPKDGTGTFNIASHQLGMLEELEKAHIYIEQLHKAIQRLQETVERHESRLRELTKAAE